MDENVVPTRNIVYGALEFFHTCCHVQIKRSESATAKSRWSCMWRLDNT